MKDKAEKISKTATWVSVNLKKKVLQMLEKQERREFSVKKTVSKKIYFCLSF